MKTLIRAFMIVTLTAVMVVFVGHHDLLAADKPAEKTAKAAAKAKAKNADKAAKKAERLQALEEARKAEEAKAAEEARKEEAARKAFAAEMAKPKPTTLPQDALSLAKKIDQHIETTLKAEGIPTSERSSDAEFLRRVSLDIAGVIPSADRAKAFLDDSSPDKRAKLIDEMLASSNYGRKQADHWHAKLFPRDSMNRFVSRAPLTQWLQEQFNKNTSWDQIVTNLVAANGTLDENPAVIYVLANRTIDKLTDTTTQHFMGVRLACAQCHNHPFTPTKQAEYWGMAAFFAKIQYDNPKNPNNGGDNSKLGVRDTKNVNRQKDFFPESAMKNVSTKFFGDKEISVPSGESPRAVLAKWLTSPTNPYFAKAMVNRTWAQLFGNGFVDPIDDLIAKNKPSHPELFDELASHFARTGFDVKYLIKAICLSDTYQRSAKPTEGNKDDVELFSHMNVKVMTPEQLFDSLYQIIPAANDRQAARNKAMQMRGGPVTARDRFVTFFLAGAEEANQAEYEPGIPQALQLMNSRIIGNPAAVRAFMTSGSKPADVIEKMYLATLSRRPTAEETKRLEDYVRSASTPAEAYSDILWAVVNSSEFTLIR